MEFMDIIIMLEHLVPYTIFTALYIWLVWDTKKQSTVREDRLMQAISSLEKSYSDLAYILRKSRD